MRDTALIFLLLIFGLNLNAQVTTLKDDGKVSYVTSENIYVRFNSTKHILIGDTLFVERNGKDVPALRVTNLSSISCVCVPISKMKFVENNKVTTKKYHAEAKDAPVEKTANVAAITPAAVPQQNSINENKSKLKQSIRGRLSVASYSNFSNTSGGNNQRMRYTFSLSANHIGNSKFSTDTYISFVHSNKNWDEIKSNIFNGLKIYNLDVKYEPTKDIKILLGRNINRKVSNIGAIDGIQFEKTFHSLSAGAFVGTRPSYIDYSIDFNLPQFGAYISHTYAGNSGNMQSTLAFVEQRNNGLTDRRFAYLQHSNTLIKKLFFFASAELELYQNIDSVKSSNVNLTNLYLMLRYRIIKQLSVSLSYRSNSSMIYYVAYKDYVQQLLDQATVTGYRFQVNYRATKNISIGARASYRNAKKDPRPTKSLYTYLSFSRIPGLKVSATLSATFLETSYMSGKIYSIGISRDIIPGKLQGSVGYRYVDYKFLDFESSLAQNVGDVNLVWRIMRKLSLSMSYEGIFESTNTYNRLYINIIKHF